jgi:TolA-binding protein
MEKLKDNAMYLTVANSVGLFGATTYFYKQLETMKSDMVKISQTLTGIVRKLAELEKGNQNKTEALHTLNEQIRNLSDEIDNLPNFDNLENDIEELVLVLQENNIPFERTNTQMQSKKSQNKKTNFRRDNDERKETFSRNKSVKNDKKIDKQRSETFRERDTDNSFKSTKDTRKVVKYNDDDDDDDLIGEVRKQQLRS